MEIKLARTAGFCMGVKRAVDLVLDIAQHKGNEKIYTYGPLIHNPQTVELLKKRGIVPVTDLSSVEEGTIIIRAHGISPQERKILRDKGLKIIDATCPRVGRVQAIIKKHAGRGYTVLIVGDKEHPEVDGLLGYSAGQGIVIGRLEDVEALPSLERVCVVAQTTQSSEDYAAIIDRIRSRFPDVLVFDTICDSTEKRQSEIRDLAAEMDAVFIVGGRNSANTRRLAQMSTAKGIPTFHIETAEELDGIPIDAYEKIGVSAGASTPNWIIERVVDHITGRLVQKRRTLKQRLINVSLLAIRTDVYSALGAGCLAIASAFLQRESLNPLAVLMASAYVFSVHTLNRLIDREATPFRGSFREESYLKHEKVFAVVAVFCMFISLLSAYLIGRDTFLVLSLISIVGALYNTRVFPRRWRVRRLKDLPGTKNTFMAIAWAAVVAVVPQVDVAFIVKPAMVVAFFFTFSVVFVRSALSDVMDIQSDRLMGRETIPVVIGEEQTRRLVEGLSIVLFLVLALSFPLGWTSTVSFALLACVFYMWICFELCDRKAAFSAAVLNGFLETNYILAGVVTIVWFVFRALFLLRGPS
jgi:4-hydroxy-3-methylbut-2-enyl diphosphate reductase